MLFCHMHSHGGLKHHYAWCMDQTTYLCSHNETLWWKNALLYRVLYRKIRYYTLFWNTLLYLVLYQLHAYGGLKHIYIYIYICICVHTYTHTYMRIHRRTLNSHITIRICASHNETHSSRGALIPFLHGHTYIQSYTHTTWMVSPRYHYAWTKPRICAVIRRLI